MINHTHKRDAKELVICLIKVFVIGIPITHIKVVLDD